MLKITKISIDYQENPLGVAQMPQFAWQMESDLRNVKQASYRLQLASEASFTEILYDSGEVRSDRSAHLTIQDFSIESARKYYVRVQVRSEEGASAWSEPAYFVTALLASEEWQAPFISAEIADEDKEIAKGTRLLGEIKVQKQVVAAYAYTTALGLYNFYLNGEKVGADELTPGWTSYRRNLLYQTYDITGMVQEGVNEAEVWLGPGWYKGTMGLTRAMGNYGEQTAFGMQLVLYYIDGSKEVICTDESWQGSDSPIVFSEIYDGETYDARLENASWHPVVTVPYDKGVLYPQSGSRVQEIEEMPAKEIFTTPKGEKVIDFGQNMTGRIHVTATGKPGDVLELKCFEVLDSKGNVYYDNLRHAQQTMTYIFAEEKTVTWYPRFTFMGFQYAEIIQYPGTLEKENFRAYTMHSQMERTGYLKTSNSLLNQLHHNILWGMKGNFLDVPTDCPQRDERLGWTGDAQIFCPTATYLMNDYTFFKKWLRDLQADQTPEGGVPHVIPNIEEGREKGNWLLEQSPHSSSAWADAAVIIPWTLHLMTGDREILELQYDSMKAWIDFMMAHSEDFLWTYKMQLGDWVALDAEEGSYFGATPTELTCTAFFAYSTGLFARMAEVLKRPEAATYEQLYEQIREKFWQTFFDGEGRMTTQTQTAHIVALHFRLTPSAYVEQTIAGLKRLIAEAGGHLVTGFIGTPYFCLALSDYGALDEAYKLLLREEFPSWLYSVKQGATTIWEHWDGLKPDGTMWSADMNSFNHYAYGAVGEWMYKVMGGISPDPENPGFDHSIYYPRFGGDLTSVETEYTSVHGCHGIQYVIRGDRVTMNIQIPVNTTAEVRLDGAVAVEDGDGIDFGKSGGDYVAKVGSGNYSIRFRRG